MSDITEKRVHDDDAGATEVIVAAEIGIVSVSVSAGRIGRFGVTHRCAPRDIAAGDGILGVATDEAVLRREDKEFVTTGFGPAVAVGVRDGTMLAADEDGRVARLEHAGGAWTDIGTVDADVRSIDGPLLATDAGVYRLSTEKEDTTIAPAGLDAVNDVAAQGPYAAAGEGLYALGNGWMRAIDGEFETVAAVSRERACAAGGDIYERVEGTWQAVAHPTDDDIVDVAVGERAYAVTGSGTLLAGHDWRARALGVHEVVGVTVV